MADFWRKSLYILLAAVVLWATLMFLIFGLIEYSQGGPGTYRFDATVSGLEISKNGSGEVLGIYASLSDGTVNGCVIGKNSNCRPQFTSVLLTKAEAGRLSLGGHAVVDCVVSDYTFDIYANRVHCSLVSP